MHFVPSMLDAFLRHDDVTDDPSWASTLRHVMSSGEALPVAAARRWAELTGVALHNLYGPTEAAVDVTWWPCATTAGVATAPGGTASVPIGRPIWNTGALVLDHLLRPGIERLIDVRKNAMSRKYGFAGKTIARLCDDVDIEYIHVPTLGIPSSMRTDLSSQEAYDRLFDKYEAKILPGATESIASVAELCSEKASALMCFEASSCQCHRGRLAPRVAAESGLEVKHL